MTCSGVICAGAIFKTFVWLETIDIGITIRSHIISYYLYMCVMLNQIYKWMMQDNNNNYKLKSIQLKATV